MITKQEIARFISDEYYSDRKKSARVGHRYYLGKHDIEKCRLFYYDSDGNLREDRYRSNVKIPHPFFTEIVDQAVQYTFSGDRILKSDNPKFQKLLDEQFNFNENFMVALSEVVTGCISKGSEYLYLYRNSEGKISFQSCDSLCVTEVPAKNSSDNTDYLIYTYEDTTDFGKRKVKRIQVWDKSFVHFFMQTENGVIVPDDRENENPLQHTVYTDSEGGEFCESFGFIPFFRLDNNSRRMSDLFVIKELIDDYDLMASSLSNNLIDFDMPLYAVTGFEGDNLDELQQNLKTKKLIGLDEGGNVEVKTIDVPYHARETKLSLDEKNIYRFGMGLDINSLRDTAATTNIAIKAAYSLLDLKCAKLETRLRSFLRGIVEFVLSDIAENEFSMSDLRFEFRHEVMSNAYENAQIEKLAAEENQIKIQTLMSVSDLLDDETFLYSICQSLEIDYNEIASKLKEKKEENA